MLKNEIRLTKKFSAFLLLFMFAAGIILAVYFLYPPKIYISEICTANDGNFSDAQFRDADGKLCDWIEIFNPTSRDVSLSGFSLRKNGGEQQPIGDYTVKSGEYILIYCSKNGFTDSSQPSVDFSISKAEDSVIELDYAFSVCEKIDVCKMEKGYSYSKNDRGEMYISEPTPLCANSSVQVGATPVFSRQSGFYAEGFSLEISAAEGQNIFYTLDGTDPRSSDTRVAYSGAVEIKNMNGTENRLSSYDPVYIQLNLRPGRAWPPEDEDVDKGTVIRACAQSSDGKYGKVSTAAYFVGLTTADHNDLPVISVVTSPDSLYDEESGIYCTGEVYEEYYERNPYHYYNGAIPANYNQKGKEWERECYIEFFESDGSLKISQDAGMRIQGGWSRAEYQKSFRFFARSKYGKGSFNYAFWDGLTDSNGNVMDSFDTIVLRNGGNDTNYCKFKDIMFQDMVSEKDFSTQTGRACVLFIDGEYWGLYTLQEDYTADYFEYHYGVPESEVVIYKTDKLEEGEPADELSFNSMRDYIAQNDMSVEENYRKAESMLDMESFAQYIAAEIYLYNDDWPQNNYGCWKTRNVISGNRYSDGRWRFFMFDTESSAWHYNDIDDQTDIFAYLESKNNYPLGSIINSLLKNPEFKDLFLTSLMDMRNINFDYGTYKQYLTQYKSVYYEEMKSYFKRFPTYYSIENSTDQAINRMNSFFFKRQRSILKSVEAAFTVSERRTVSIRSEDFLSGTVLVNGSEIRSDFSGTYYDGSRLTLTAEPKDGYIFTGWKINGKETDENSSELNITVSGNVNVTAQFEKSIL